VQVDIGFGDDLAVWDTMVTRLSAASTAAVQAGLVRIPLKPNARSTASRTAIPLQAEHRGAKRRVCLPSLDDGVDLDAEVARARGFADCGSKAFECAS
jgi:hypothetical protein